MTSQKMAWTLVALGSLCLMSSLYFFFVQKPTHIYHVGNLHDGFVEVNAVRWAGKSCFIFSMNNEDHKHVGDNVEASNHRQIIIDCSK